MKIGVLTVNDFSFHPNMRLQQAAQASGHEIILINPYDLCCSLDQGSFGFFIEKIFDGVDIILPRQGSAMGEYGLVLLGHFMHMDKPLVNGLAGITIARNQFITLQTLVSSGLRVPSTVFITKASSFSPAVKQLGGFPVVIKQVDGMGGEGVFKIDNQEQAAGYLIEGLKERKGLLVQQFIPPKERTDIRVFVIGEKIAGAMALVPDNQDFRTNIHQKGQAMPIELPESYASMALQAAKACHLEIAGVDLIVEKGGEPMVLEVNYSPGFKGLESITGEDVAKQIVAYVESAQSKFSEKKRQNDRGNPIHS